MNSSGALFVEVASLPASTSTIEVVGDAAENAAVAGNPVLVGGRYDSSGRTLGDGDVGAVALDADGAVHIADGGNAITVDGTVTANLSATDNAVLDAMVVDLAAIEVDLAAMEVLLTAANVDHAANEALLITIDEDTNAIKGHVDGIETLITSTNSKIDTFDAVLDNILTKNTEIDAVLDTIKTDTGTIDSDTNDTKNALNKMLYGTGLVITALDGGGGDQTLGATYESLYVGVGGNVKVTLATSASDFTFVNVASGQMLPIQITHVKQSGTTATNMIAMKA
jgi:hypothetical protein